MMSRRRRGPRKLSNEFAARLASIPAKQKLHVVVLLAAGPEDGGEEPQRSCDRQSQVTTVRCRSRGALESMDRILAKSGGRRLDENVNALGAVAVEATPAGIRRLVSLKDVETVLEDQGVLLVG